MNINESFTPLYIYDYIVRFRYSIRWMSNENKNGVNRKKRRKKNQSFQIDITTSKIIIILGTYSRIVFDVAATAATGRLLSKVYFERF